MERRYRVLFVPGTGIRDRASSTWWTSEVGVALGHALPVALLARLDVESSTHGRLLRDSPSVVNLTCYPGQRRSDPGAATDCTCCVTGAGYRRSVAIIHCLPYDLRRFVEEKVVRLMYPDVVRFAGDPQLRAVVRQRVREDLNRVKPDIVIAHSLGSAVAIEALAVSEWSPQLLITAGAPLAWPRFVETWSSDARGWLSRQSCAWTNLVDLTDLVTGSQILPRSPYGNALNVVVDNDHHARIFGSDREISSNHSLRHYLCHPAVADAFLSVCR